MLYIGSEVTQYVCASPTHTLTAFSHREKPARTRFMEKIFSSSKWCLFIMQRE